MPFSRGRLIQDHVGTSTLFYSRIPYIFEGDPIFTFHLQIAS
jgi:hypothetical protein